MFTNDRTLSKLRAKNNGVYERAYPAFLAPLVSCMSLRLLTV